MSDYYQTLVESKLIPTGESGTNVIYHCPVCERGSGSGHLYVDFDKGVFHCFKCGFKGRSIPTLLSYLGYDRSSLKDIPVSIIKGLKDNAYDELLGLDRYLNPLDIVPSDYSTDLRILTDYIEFHSRSLTTQARDYLHARGIDDQKISHYSIREGVDQTGRSLTKDIVGKDYSGRILVPSISGDNMTFFVARDYLGRSNVPKYMNPPQTLAYSSEDVWNLSNVSSKIVIVCEGVFTAISAGYSSVATYGKSLSSKSNSSISGATSQGEKLVRRGFNEYIIAYDADAGVELGVTCDYLYSRGMNVSYVKVPEYNGNPHTDLSDLPQELRFNLIKNRVEYNPALFQLDSLLHTSL